MDSTEREAELASYGALGSVGVVAGVLLSRAIIRVSIRWGDPRGESGGVDAGRRWNAYGDVVEP